MGAAIKILSEGQSSGSVGVFLLTQGSGTLQRLEPTLAQLGKIDLDDGSFGYENVGVVIDLGKGFDKESPQTPLGAIALDGVAHFFAGDKGHLRRLAPAIEEDEPRRVPDSVRSFVDSVELTLSRQSPEAFYTANLFLPLARRALITLRPFLLFIRVRKP